MHKYILSSPKEVNYSPDTEANPLVERFEKIQEIRGIIYQPVIQPSNSITICNSNSPTSSQCNQALLEHSQDLVSLPPSAQARTICDFESDQNPGLKLYENRGKRKNLILRRVLNFSGL